MRYKLISLLLGFVMVVVLFGNPNASTASPCIPGYNCPGDPWYPGGGTPNYSLSVSSMEEQYSTSETFSLSYSITGSGSTSGFGQVIFQQSTDGSSWSTIGSKSAFVGSSSFSFTTPSGPDYTRYYKICAEIPSNTCTTKTTRINIVNLQFSMSDTTFTKGENIAATVSVTNTGGTSNQGYAIKLKLNDYTNSEYLIYQRSTTYFQHDEVLTYNLNLDYEDALPNRYHAINAGDYQLRGYRVSSGGTFTYEQAINIDVNQASTDQIFVWVYYDQEFQDLHGTNFQSLFDGVLDHYINNFDSTLLDPNLDFDEHYGSFTDRFDTEIDVVGTKKFNPSTNWVGAVSPGWLMDQAQDRTDTDFDTVGDWDHVTSTDKDNSGVDLVIVLSGHKSSTSAVGEAGLNGNLMAVNAKNMFGSTLSDDQLDRLILHELMHIMGLEHYDWTGQIMDPNLNNTAWKLIDFDHEYVVSNSLSKFDGF